MAAVLIVEDDFFLASELGQSLTEAGHTVVGEASSFEDAAKIAAASPPQVALVDYRRNIRTRRDPTGRWASGDRAEAI
jgi:DNA-binding NarL/FixJ family response regulator